jgi:hypothetical protein
VYQPTAPDATILYRRDPDPAVAGEPVGSSAQARLAGFLAYVQRLGIWRPLAEPLRLPVQERRSGVTHLQKRQVLVAAWSAGLPAQSRQRLPPHPDPMATTDLGLPRRPHSGQRTSHLHAFRPQHIAALRRAVQEILARHSSIRRRLRRVKSQKPKYPGQVPGHSALSVGKEQ